MKRKKFDERVIALIEQNLPYLMRYDGESPREQNKFTIVDRILPCYTTDCQIGYYPRRHSIREDTSVGQSVSTYEPYRPILSNAIIKSKHIPINSYISWRSSSLDPYCYYQWGLHLTQVSVASTPIQIVHSSSRIKIRFEIKNYSKWTRSATLNLSDFHYDPPGQYVSTWMAFNIQASGTAHTINYLWQQYGPTIHFNVGGRSPNESYSFTILTVTMDLALNVVLHSDYGVLQIIDDQLYRVVDWRLKFESAYTNNFTIRFSMYDWCTYQVYYAEPDPPPPNSGGVGIKEYWEPQLYLEPVEREDYHVELFQPDILPEVPDLILDYYNDPRYGLAGSPTSSDNVIIITIHNFIEGTVGELAFRELRQAFEPAMSIFWNDAFKDPSVQNGWVVYGNVARYEHIFTERDLLSASNALRSIGMAIEYDEIDGSFYVKRLHLFTKTLSGAANTNPSFISSQLQTGKWMIVDDIRLGNDGKLVIVGSLKNAPNSKVQMKVSGIGRFGKSSVSAKTVSKLNKSLKHKDFIVGQIKSFLSKVRIAPPELKDNLIARMQSFVAQQATYAQQAREATEMARIRSELLASEQSIHHEYNHGQYLSLEDYYHRVGGYHYDDIKDDYGDRDKDSWEKTKRPPILLI